MGMEVRDSQGWRGQLCPEDFLYDRDAVATRNDHEMLFLAVMNLHRSAQPRQWIQRSHTCYSHRDWRVVPRYAPGECLRSVGRLSSSLLDVGIMTVMLLASPPQR